jgi:hypothetical protein
LCAAFETGSQKISISYSNTGTSSFPTVEKFKIPFKQAGKPSLANERRNLHSFQERKESFDGGIHD